MEFKRDHILLAEKIRGIFDTGSTLGSDVADYIDSTFSNPTIEEIQAVIADESNCEKDTLIELLFFPGESVQVRLESLLGDETLGYSGFQKNDEEKVLNHLYAKTPKTVIRFPDGRGEFKMEIPHEAAESFLSRLNITNKPDERVAAAITEHVPEKFRALYNVRLRNSRFAHAENKINFLVVFFGKIGSKSSDPVACLDFILRFLEEIEAGADISEALKDRKRTIMKNLEKTSIDDRKNENSNIETMILQGIRTPYFNKQEAMKQVVIIDEIVAAVFKC